MSRSIVTLLVVILLVVGGLYLLGGHATERPLTTVEKQVSLANLR